MGRKNALCLNWRNRRKALTEGILAGSSFGTAAIFIRFLPNISVYTIAAGRLIVATLTLAVIIKILGQRWPIGLLKEFKKEIFFLGVLLGLHFMLFASSVKNTTIINATVLVNTVPVQAAIVSTFISRVRPSRWEFGGILISFLGVVIITFKKLDFSINLLGDIAALLAAFVEALYLNYGREVRVRSPILPLMSVLYSVSTLTIILSSLALGSSVNVALDPSQLMFILLLGILPTAIGHTLYFSALSGLKSFETATLALLEPVGATLLGIAFFSEVPEPVFVVGAIFVLSGVMLVVK